MMKYTYISLFVLLFFTAAFGQVKETERDILSRAWKDYNSGELDGAEKSFKSISGSKDQNTAFEAIMGLGYTLLRKNSFDEAKKHFTFLVEKGYRSDKTVPAMIDVCIGTKDFETLKLLFDKIPDSDKKRVKKLILYHEMSASKEGSEKRYMAAMEMLKMDGNDSFALNILAWHSYNEKEYGDAVKYFKVLLEQNRSDEKYVTGLGYSLINLGRFDEALHILDNMPRKKSREIDSVKLDLFKRIVVYIEERDGIKNREEKEIYLHKILEIAPHDTFAVNRLAKLYVERGDKAKAKRFIIETYDWKKNNTFAFTLLVALDETGFKSYAFEVAKEYAKSDNQVLKEAASGYFISKDFPVSASMADQSKDKLYSNAYSSRFEAAYYHRHRSGDDGKSRLEEDAVPLAYTMTEGFGRQWFLTVKTGYLDSGSAVSKAGSYYRYLNGDETLTELGNRTVYNEIHLGMEKEGIHRYSFLLGTSPLGTDVSVTPVFQFIYHYDLFRFDLHRTPVNDTILSFAGLDDPYTDDSWGRVMKNGGAIGKTLDLNSFWITAEASYNYYDGENVWENKSWQVDTAIGKSYSDFKDVEITLGIFLTYMEYDRNTNFFTYGHGGYYSPESLFVVGPLFRAKTKPYKKYWFDLQLSTGWMDEKTADSPFYPISDQPASLNAQASNDYNSIYEGSTNSGLSFTLKFEGWRLLTSEFSMGTYLHINQSPGYNEWKAGFAIEYSFEPWYSFFKRENIDNRFTIR